MTRRSVRHYTDKAVEGKTIETLLRAAMQAPSAHNAQPWHFIVITERRILDAVPEFHSYARMLLEAPAAILVCGDLGVEESPEYINQACSAAAQNILLASHTLGLGAVWLGIYPREKRVREIRRLLRLPSRIIPVSLVALGYPAEKKAPADRYQPQRVHFNCLGEISVKSHL